MPKQIVFSDRAMTALLVETYEKIKTETGGVFLGYRKGDVWYVVETIDPGPDSIFRTAYFEYDQAYINHLINKISRLYREQLDLIGLWHRHPGSLDEFSSTDDGTNKQYAQLDKDGAVSALVNIDPTFRLTVYEVKEPLSYKKINYVVGDENIPVHLLGYVSQKLLTSKINDTSNQVPGKPKASFSNLLKQYQI
ncbi:Mov34/MPN/PAD-1 family protein, partial [Acidaminobacter sp.]|uniref:Mov34/MPN/PAD-1 family protein n=1 Tax=Acidaminobacter sp. TaxID=1872102 RepID=UPI0025626680